MAEQGKLWLSRDKSTDDACGDVWCEPPERSEGDCEEYWVGEGFMGTIAKDLLAFLRPDLKFPEPGACIEIPVTATPEGEKDDQLSRNQPVESAHPEDTNFMEDENAKQRPAGGKESQ